MPKARKNHHGRYAIKLRDPLLMQFYTQLASSHCQIICHARVKCLGAWWYVESSNRMLALRYADYNGTFGRAFQKYIQKMQVSGIM